MPSYNLGRFKSFIQAAKTQRVAITGHFNSNGEYQGSGWVSAIIQNLIRRGIMVNAVRPVTNLTTNTGTGANDNNSGGPSEFAMNGAIRVPLSTSTGGLIHSSNILVAETTVPNLARYYSYGKYNIGKAVSAFFPTQYRCHHFSAVSTPSTIQMGNGIQINNAPNLGMSWDVEGMCVRTYKKVVADFWVGSGAPATGSFQAVMVHNSTPNLVVVQDSKRTIPVEADPLTMQRYSIEASALAANTGRDTQLRACHSSGTFVPTGQVFFGYTVVFEGDSAGGSMVAPLISMGGSNMHDWARALGTSTAAEKLTEETVKHWFDVITRPASYKSQSGKVIWFLWDGVNYKNETRVSFENSQTAASKAAYKDDLNYVINKLTTYWTGSGRSLNDLCIVVCTDHPAEDYATQQKSYTQGAIEVIQAAKDLSPTYDHVCVLDLFEITSVSDLKGPVAAGSEDTLYDLVTLSGQAHLSTPGLNGRKYNGYFEIMCKIFDKWLPRKDVKLLGVTGSIASRQRRIVTQTTDTPR